VKELVENSLDADAFRVAVAVECGGIDGIRVRDDGVGMTADELELAVEEHTTSKIGGIDDLDAGVGTLGFRGEALYTIGAVSELTVRSKPHGSAGAGNELTVDHGETGEVRPAGCPEGTVVEVAELFSNTPARKKFLKTATTEFDHVNTVVTKYALANPDVAVSLEHDGREVFATEGRGSLESAVLSVYGREVAESMVEVEWPSGEDGGETASQRGADAGDGGTDAHGEAGGSSSVSVSGLVSHPETTRAGREYMSTFVNGRYVRSSALREAVLDAYGDQLATDRYPFAVLFVEVPPDAVDVNVHPRKTEVRFDAESAVADGVREAVESALLDHGLLRSTAPRGRSAPEEAAVDPAGDGRDVVGGAGGESAGAGSESAGSGSDPSEAPRDAGSRSTDGTAVGTGATDTRASEPESATDDDRPASEPEPRGDETGPGATVEAEGGAGTRTGGTGGTDGTDGSGSSDHDPWCVDISDGSAGSGGADGADGADGASPAEPSTPTRSRERSAGAGPGGVDPSDHAGVSDRSDDAGAATPDERQSSLGSVGGDAGNGSSADADDPADPGGPGSAAADRPFGVVAPTEQWGLDGEPTGDAELDSLPSMRVLGQLHDTYVVAETGDGLVLVDQHAADERVNYERLRREVLGDPGSEAQALADPVTLELTAREATLFEEYAPALADLGFEAERVGSREVEVRTVPAVFASALGPELLRDALSSFVADGDDGGREAVESVADALLADLACYPSVTGNTSLTEGSVVDLLEALDDCENPYACPHGRPVVIRFSRTDIEERFERDYPGHGGRRSE
jgi:DNA mismatch repair protein MutL